MKAFCWVDIETTGLNKKTDQILEIACILTDYELNEFDEPFHSLVSNYEVVDWDEFVVDMHTTSGLINDLENNKAPFIESVDKELVNWIKSYKDDYDIESVTLAGSTVGRFDSAFIERDFPQFTKELTHRAFDCSTLKMFAEMQGIEKFPENKGNHRAMSDVRDSLEYARTFKKSFSYNKVFNKTS